MSLFLEDSDLHKAFLFLLILFRKFLSSDPQAIHYKTKCRLSNYQINFINVQCSPNHLPTRNEKFPYYSVNAFPDFMIA